MQLKILSNHCESSALQKPCRVHKVSTHLFSFGSNIYDIWAQGLLEKGYTSPASLAAECDHITNFQPMESKQKGV